MDVLSEVLRVIRLEGALFFNGEFSAPWCVSTSGSTSLAPYLHASGRHVIIYHLLTEGRAYAHLPGGPRQELNAGDIVIFPHGDAHLLGNGNPERPVDSLRTFADNLTRGLKAVRYGGGGEVTRFVCGFMACDPRLSEVVLAGLPRLTVVHIGDEPSGDWLRKSIRFSVGESGSEAGGDVVLAKLSEVLFIETLRRYIQSLPADRTGWLAGAKDPVIGRILAMLHNRPQEPWTVASLARQAGMSRTRLAERFRHFLGETPMAYLMRWRMNLAADMLHSTEQTAAEIAAAVGYNSEAAFNRAFKREYQCPPARFRRDGSAESMATAT